MQNVLNVRAWIFGYVARGPRSPRIQTQARYLVRQLARAVEARKHCAALALEPPVSNFSLGCASSGFFYWLYLLKLGSIATDPKSVPIIRASYSKANRTVQIDQPYDYVATLLNSTMVSPLEGPIAVYPGPQDG